MAEDNGPARRVVRKRVVKKAPSAAPGSTGAHPTTKGNGRRSARFRLPRLHLPRELPAVPPIPQRAALAASGAVAGLVAVGLTVLMMLLFEVVRGTSTGGGAWGLLGLVVVVALSVGAGAFLLSSLRIAQPRLTAVVGALLVLIVVLAFLLDAVFSAWMWLVIPVLSALAYVGTNWVLTRAEA
ncbi:MAG: hypothetical protein ACRDO8_14420 [Nocardioidaceae bacterium]